MQASRTNFLDHLRWLREAARVAGADFLVAGHTFHALLRLGDRSWILEPRFVSGGGDLCREVPELEDAVLAFGGWLPYPMRTWDVAEDRVRFNALMRKRGVPVSELVFDEAPELENVLVRSVLDERRSIALGPFRRANEYPLDQQRGEYYERYVRGPHLRLWYWTGQLVCGEMYAMPTVRGNGMSTVRELIAERALHDRPWPEEDLTELMERVGACATFHGSGLGAVLPAGATAIVDHGIESPLMHPSDRRIVDLRDATDAGWVGVARKAGTEVLASSPPEWRAGTLFALEAVLDEKGSLWIVGLDANPPVHPVAYPIMVRSLLSDTTSDADRLAITKEGAA